jgi:vitamin B12 transporter
MGNIGNAELKGVTIAASTSIHGWSINGNLDIQSPENSETKKMLPFRANRHGSIDLGKSWGDWNFNSELIGSSERYNNPSNTQKMNGYMIVNLVADYKINNEWSLQGRVNNLFNKDYALALNSAGNLPYNTPGSNLFVSLAWRAK